MAKIVLTISADNKATQSVKLLNAEVQTLSKTLSSIKVNKNLTAQINALTKHYKAVADAHAKITANANKQAIADQKLLQQQTRSRTEAVKLEIAQARLEKAQKKTTTSTEQLQKKFANLLSTIKSLKNAYPQGTFDSIEQSVRANLKAAQDGTKGVEELGQAYNELSRDLAVAKAETEKVTTAVVKSGDSIGSLAKKFLLWQITATLVMKPLRLIGDALNSINETLVKTEDAVIALQRVVGKGISGEEISSGLYKLAKDYGQTVENVQSLALDFARTGLSWEDTLKATQAALLGLNTAELDATKAATGLIAVLQQYKLDASDLESVIDKLNITQDNAAVTTDKLLTALSRTGSAAVNANLSLEQTVALITALSSATGRSGENLGTALNSLIQYSSKSTALDTFSKLSDEAKEVVDNYRKGMKKADGETYTILDVWRQVSKEMQNLKSEQADLLDAYFNTEDGSALQEALDGELKDFYTEMGGVYDTANTFRKNYFIALLGNMDEVEKALGRMDEAAGYSQAQQNDYMQSYTAQLNEVKAQWEYLATKEQGLLELKKFGLDVAEMLLKLIQNTGGLRTTIMAAATALTFLAGDKIINGIVKIGKSFKGLTSPVNNFTKAVEASRAAKQASAAATEAQNTADAIRNGQLIEGITLEQADKTAKEMQTIATQKATVATQAWGVAIKTALGVIGLVITGVSMLVGIIDSVDQNKAQEQAEWVSKVGDEAGKAVEKLSDLQNAIDGTKQAYEDYAKKVEEARKVLDDENSTTEEIASAKSTLNEIQKTLVDSNSEYASSIDVINGKLAEQLNLLTLLGEEQARKQVHDYLEKNSGALYDANKYLTEKHSEIKFEEAVGEWDGLFSDAPLEAWLKSLGYDASEQAGLGEGLGSFFTNSKVFKTTLFHDGMTLDEQLAFLKKLRAEAAKIADQEQREYIDSQLNKAEIAITSTDAYKQSNNLIKGNSTSSNWIERLTLEQLKQIDNGTLTIEQVKKLLGVEKEVSKEIAIQTNDISKLSDSYKDIISSLKEMRDLSKETTEWEDKKLEVLEAQKALEDARNQATVRRFNSATGNWEWQVDEKAVKNAEKDLKSAKENYSDATFDKLIHLFENYEEHAVTNPELKKIIDEATPLLGEEFAKSVYDYFKNEIGVNLNEPAKTESVGGSGTGTSESKNYTIPSGIGRTTQAEKDGILNALKNGDYEAFKRYMPSAWDEEKKRNAYTKSGGVFDRGGIANGLGFMPKATSQPESVNDPELTKLILTPTSNKEFTDWVKANRIMFADAHNNYARMPQFERINNTTDNSVNNSGQINFAGGLTVGSDKRGSSIDELLTLANIVPNN